jgi:hypothetical protein
MNPLLFTLILLAPIVSKNPIEQDTIKTINIHLFAGFHPGNEMLTPGGEAGAKFEYLLIHPFVVRASTDYNFASVSNAHFPKGDQRSLNLAFETFIYRGQKKLTAYLGGGVIYAVSNFHLEKQINDTLITVDKPQSILTPADTVVIDSTIYKTDIENRFGYRIFLGLRFKEHFSLELGYQQLKPFFSFWRKNPGGDNQIIYKQGKMSTVRFTAGYVFPL